MILRRAAWLPPLAAVGGCAILLYWTSTSRPLWVDEEMLLLNVRDRGFLQLAGPLWLDQSAPLGWLAVERMILLTFGPSEPSVRLLTILFGIGTLATAAWIGRRWMSVGAAAVFVAVCALAEWPVFFTLELKHYSADMCGALLVPALAARALEDDRSTPFASRLFRWWIAAAVGQWFSNGALFVTPLCGIILLAAAVRSGDKRATPAVLAGGGVWVVTFAANYALVLRHAASNPYLQNYWAFAFPPTSHGVQATLVWIGDQARSFAVKPGSTRLPALFWIAWLVGSAFAISTRRTHGLFAATVPLSGLGLALFHVIPPFERLAIWMVPSIYAGLAYGVDAAAALPRYTPARRSAIGRQPSASPPASARPGWRMLLTLGSLAALTLTLAVPANIVRRGVTALQDRPHSNYGLDDRRSIAFLLSTHRRGDAVMTTHFGLAALWWYGRIPVSDPARGRTLADGSPIYEIHHRPAEEDCAAANQQMNAVFAEHTRVAMYLGFRMNVEPVGFDALVLREGIRRGALAAYKEYAEESRLAIFEAGRPGIQADGLPGTVRGSVPNGCVSVQPASRW